MMQKVIFQLRFCEYVRNLVEGVYCYGKNCFISDKLLEVVIYDINRFSMRS